MTQKMKIRPLSDTIVVRPDPKPTMSEGGLHLPATANDDVERTAFGEVLAAGPGRTYVLDDRPPVTYPVPVKVGDRVVYNRFSGEKVTLDGETYVTIRADSVIGVIEPA